ncbi:MAG TPA: hypothetical protein VI197_17755 [Polyangiaceae bacterium]
MQATHSPVSTPASNPEAIPESHPAPSSEFAAIEPASGTVGLELAERVAAALTASVRAEASLRAMFRSVKFLGASVGAARETNEALVNELSTLQELLGERAVPSGNTSVKALEARAHLLEQALGEAAEQAVRDREFLLAEHDSFIASLVGDHEKELANLRRRVSEAESRLAARELRDFDFGWDAENGP